MQVRWVQFLELNWAPQNAASIPVQVFCNSPKLCLKCPSTKEYINKLEVYPYEGILLSNKKCNVLLIH